MTLPDKTRTLAEAWLGKADGDLLAARGLIADPGIPAWIVGFHLQQAVEKAWKGRLVLVSIRPPPIHDLRTLIETRDPQALDSEVVARR
ncbi:MAG TPA: HEPN domain-containing protein [Myxococcota bacterium]|nr:HEPN domain-containing protein [Myxococcota bacterium]HQK52594.1 HEPN domain-containing protein [Myxococcota bacterium]